MFIDITFRERALMMVRDMRKENVIDHSSPSAKLICFQGILWTDPGPGPAMMIVMMMLMMIVMMPLLGQAGLGWGRSSKTSIAAILSP